MTSEIPPPTDPSVYLSRLIDGYLVTQLLYVAAKMGVVEVLAERPQTAAAVASLVHADPGAHHRVMRGLAAEGILFEQDDGSFGLTEVSALLRADAPGSLRGAILARGDLYFRAAAGLHEAVRDGHVAFEREHGSSFFDCLREHPEMASAFQESMTARSRHEAAPIVLVYDFSEYGTIIDVGGGDGTLLETILHSTPGARGVLFDLPTMAERARNRLHSSSVLNRCVITPGDFLRSVPSGGDVYLLSRVIHDWDDEAATAILSVCHQAMKGRGILLLVEAVLPTLAREQPAAVRMDLSMLLLLDGRERTATEYERLLAGAGFRLRRIVATASASGISIIESSPT
jgi:O-methyltransferase domain/Dimerisation domain